MSGPNTPPPSSDPSAITDAKGSSAGAGGELAQNGHAIGSGRSSRDGQGAGGETDSSAAGSSRDGQGAGGETDSSAAGSSRDGQGAGGETDSSAAGSSRDEHGALGDTRSGPIDPDKKRRRRRRKKKGDGHHADGEGAAREASEGPREAAPEGAVGGERPGPKGNKKREKRAGPPRERPPVNTGDIVFGKITEIGLDAIFIDIPGKARAIFDRSEMLLPEDDEAQGPGRPPSRATAQSPPSAAAQVAESPPSAAARVAESPPSAAAPPTAESHSGETAGALLSAAGPSLNEGVSQSPGEQAAPWAGPASGEADGRDSSSQASAPSSPHPSAQASPHPSAQASGGPQGQALPDGGHSDPVRENRRLEPAEPPKDPKVPRVILEVGADFIGVVHSDGSRGGLVVLTHHPNRAERAKPGIEAAFNDKTPISGLVTGVIKGGVEVDVDGVRAFAPGSHVDLHLGADLSHLVGSRLTFLVTQYAKRGRDVVLSRKAMLEDEARKARVEALARLKVGEDLDGIVRSVVSFGAFVDLGGVEGLVPLQEMSHNRADGPSDVFKAGEPTRVRVIKIDDKGKVWLSRKATVPDPWQQVARKYAVGTRHTGKVARLQPFGAFVELEPGVDGLVHTQDLSIKRIETPADVVKVGDPIEVLVSHVDPIQHKIALHPAPQGDAAAESPQRVAPHKPVKAKVVTIESGGLVVRILGVTGRNARGYVTAAGTGTPRGTELRKAFNVGQEIEAKVIEMDPRRGEVKLSIKALGLDQERSAYQQYRQQLKAEARFTFGDLLAKKGK